MTYQPPTTPYEPPMGQQPGGPAPMAPSNNIVWSIISIFLCWPFCIPSFIAGSKVNQLWSAGDVAGAQKASADAKKWGKIGIIVGVILWVLYIVISIIIGVVAANSAANG